MLAIAIVGIIAALVLPAVITNYQNKSLDMGFERELKTIKGAIKNLAVSENKTDFYSTMMYSDSEPDSYADTSGKFLKKYLKVSNYCGENNGDCFAPVYYTYNGTKREVYTPTYKGACASLKNGASICLTPQIGAGKITGLLDLNGKKGPNVFGRDLREFIIDQETYRVGAASDSSNVLSTPESDLVPSKGPCEENSLSKECCDTQSISSKSDPCCIHYKSQAGHVCYEQPEPPKSACELNPNSLDCCKTKTISDSSDPCCTYDEMKNSVDVCSTDVVVTFSSCHCYSPLMDGTDDGFLWDGHYSFHCITKKSSTSNIDGLTVLISPSYYTFGKQSFNSGVATAIQVSKSDIQNRRPVNITYEFYDGSKLLHSKTFLEPYHEYYTRTFTFKR